MTHCQIWLYKTSTLGNLQEVQNLPNLDDTKHLILEDKHDHPKMDCTKHPFMDDKKHIQKNPD